MRFRLEASPEELEQKGDALLRSLANELRPVAPDLADRLEKALPRPEQVLKYPALQQLADKTREEYARTLERMVEAIGKVLDRSTKADARYIEKSESLEKKLGGPFIGPRGGKWADPQHTIPWHPGLGEPEGGQEAPKVGRKVSEIPEPEWAAGLGPWKSETYSFPKGTEAQPLKTAELSALPPHWGAQSSYYVRDELKKLLGDVKAPEGYEIVYRVASGPTGLENRNAGNLEAVTDFLMQMEDRGMQYGDKITAYAVKMPGQFTSYEELRGQKPRTAPQETPKVDTTKLLTGNFGIPRIDMPQIKSTLVPDFIEQLRQKKVSVERKDEIVSTLKATQSEIHPDKVQALVDDPKARESLKKPVMVSQDGYILDGHHRWAALTTISPWEHIQTVKIGLPIKDLLKEAKDFKGVEFKKAEEEPEDFYDYTFDVFDRDDRAYNRVKRVLQSKGYMEADFEEGGALYGWSTNQLIELAHHDLEKAGGPYIGPRGGKWADPQHTQHWEQEAPRAVSGQTEEASKKKHSEQVHDILAQIVGPLKAAGLQAAVRQPKLGIKRSGFSVKSGSSVGLGGGFFLTWEDWENKESDGGVAKAREAAKALNAAGWATDEVNPGVIRIVSSPKLIKTALEAAIEHHGGKVRPHESDPTKMVVKIPVGQAEALAAIKAKYHLEDEIKLGEKYAVLPVPKAIFGDSPKKAPPKKVIQHQAPAQKPAGEKKALVPPYSKSEWKPHATVEEAKAWAKEQGVDVGYSDLATANQLNRAISEQHPWIRRHVEFLGTASQLHEWAKEHPDINKRAMTEAKHKADLKEFSLGGSAIAVAHPTTGKPYSQSVVVLTDSWGTDEKYNAKKKHLSSGFTVGTELADTVRHEFGHVEGFIFRHLRPKGPDGPSAWEIWKKHCVAQLKSAKHGVMQEISQYGATNPHECWAEVSVMRRRGMPLPAWVHAAVEEMQIDSTPWGEMGKIWSTP